MKKGLKKCLSFLLCAVMVLGSVAVGGDGFAEVLDAFSVKASATSGQQVADYANSRVGGYFDYFMCLRFAEQVYQEFGASRPYDCCAHKSADQWIVSSSSQNIPLGAAVYFNNPNDYCNNCGRNIGHVGIYVGNGEFVSVLDTSIQRRSLSNDTRYGNYWINSYIGWGWIGGYVLQTQCDHSSHNAKAEIEKWPTATTCGTRRRYCECGQTSVTEDIHPLPYTSIGNGVFSIKSALGNTYASAVSDKNVKLWNNGFVAEDQKWRFTRNSDGTYTIESYYYSGYCMDVNGASMLRGANVQAYQANGTDAQKFYVVPKGGYYEIINKKSLMAIDVEDSNTANGTNISQWSTHGETNQLWDIRPIVLDIKVGSKPVSSNYNPTAGSTITISWGAAVNAPSGLEYCVSLCNYNDEIVYGPYWTTATSKSITVTQTGTYYANVYIIPNGAIHTYPESSTITVKPSTYLVSYDANGGSGAPSSQTKTYDKTLTLSTTKPTRTGYTFKNWNTKADGTGTSYSSGASYTANAAVTLYAQWTDTAKPTGSISSTNNVAASQTATLSLSDNVGIAGYYWGTSSSYSSNTYTAISGTSKSVTKTVSSAGTYYLTVKDTSGNISSTVSKTFYKTTLNENSGSVSPSSVITMSGNSFTLPTPTRSGYSFKNWNTVSGGTGTSYTGSYKPTGSTTLYAQWTEKTYTVSFSHWCHGFEGVGTNARNDCIKIATTTRNFKYSSLSISTEDTLPASSLPNGIRIIESHYGKYGTSGISGEWSYYSAPQTFNNIAKNIDFQIDYELINYTITYNLDGGTLSAANPSTYNVVFGAKFTNNPTKTGYTFDGWTIDGTNKVTGINESVLDSSVFVDNEGLSGGKLYNALKNRTTGNKTVRALWKAITFAVSYNANGGSGAPSSQTKTYGTTLTLSSAKPTRTGYIFQNWNTKADGTGTSYSAGDSYTADADVTLYAQWKELFKYSVSDGKATITSFDKDYIGEFIIPDKIYRYPVTGIGFYAFLSCKGLTKVVIPDTITELDEGAFYNCTGLTEVVIPDSITSIGDHAFWRCLGLTEIEIPDGVKKIGVDTFGDCYNLTSVTIPDSVTSIGDDAFSSCWKLKNLTIPDNVTNIGDGAFSSCWELTNITIPDGVTSIGERTFEDCYQLTSLTIPGSVKSIGREAFRGCSNLTTLTIPESVTSIGDDAFSFCYQLTSLTIPGSVTSIGAHAFENCWELTDVYYLGSEEEWNGISVSITENSDLLNANIHFLNDEAPFKSASNIKTQKSDIVNYVSGFNLNTTVNNISQLAIDGWNVKVAGDSDRISTGSSITMTNSSITYQCIAVIFGDVNGDGWYDGTDSIIVNCIANGMLSEDDVGEAVYMAADCNHDGIIDQLDVDILNQAGILLAEVDQTKSEEELITTSSAYVEYLNLIDQTIETDTAGETAVVEDTPTTEDKPVSINWFEMIVSFLKMLLNFVYGLFTL